MFIARVLSFCFICLLSACGNSISQTDNTNNTQQINKSKFFLRLERTGCWKTCPVYKLTVQSNGEVLFEGINFTKTKGKAEGKLNENQINQLIDEINKADFFSLKDSYMNMSDGCPSYATDSPTITLFVTLNSREKTIVNNLGCSETGDTFKPFPSQLYNLENKIDEIVGTKRWISERK